MNWRERLNQLETEAARNLGAQHGSEAQWLRVVANQLAELIDVLRPLTARDDFATAATSPDVCTCAYKPYPHPRLPAHPNRPRPIASEGESG